MHPNRPSGSLSLQCRLRFAQHCRFNWKQCNVEVGTPSSLSLRCRWPCIFSFKWCLCEREKRTGLLADRWLRALGLSMGLKCIWWAPPSPVISCSASAPDDFLILLGEISALRPAVVCEGAEESSSFGAACRSIYQVLSMARHWVQTSLCAGITGPAATALELKR